MKTSKTKIAETWDQIASEYGAYRRKSWSAVSDFLAKSKGPILDIGCGNASYAANLKQKVIGLDLSLEMCKLASKHIKRLAGSVASNKKRQTNSFRPRFPDQLARGKGGVICADATHLPIKPNSFSRVISIATMHHLPTRADRLDYLREIKRVLKPGGKALVTAWYRWQKKHLPKALFTKNIHLKWGAASRFYHLFSKRELANLARKVFNKFTIKVEQGTRYKNLYLLACK